MSYIYLSPLKEYVTPEDFDFLQEVFDTFSSVIDEKIQTLTHNFSELTQRVDIDFQQINDKIRNYDTYFEQIKKQLTDIYDYVVTLQPKLTLIKNEASGDTNADLDVNGNLRIWDPSFESGEIVKNYRIMKSDVAEPSNLDTDIPTSASNEKFYMRKV